MSEWDSLRKTVRNLENELDQSISSYSKLATQLSTAYYSSQNSSQLSGSREDARRLELSIVEMLEKVSKQSSLGALSTCSESKRCWAQLGKLVDDMTSLLDSRGTSSTSAMNHTLTRHREIYSDYQRDFKRTKVQIQESEKRQNLLGSVREEISNFRNDNAGQDPSDMLLAERNRIDSSHRMTDEVLE
jgi:Golgi SNAP receptor complex protein 1